MRRTPAVSRPARALKVVGWVGVVLSLYGLSTDKLFLSTSPVTEQPTELRGLYYTMAATDITLLFATFFLAASLTRASCKLVPIFVVAQALVVLAFATPALLWSVPGVSETVLRAPPLYSVGTGTLIITVYPVWGSLVALWAAHRLGATHSGEIP